MNGEPPTKRAVAFVDGQNLFHAAREAFGYTYPNYDVSALAGLVCARQGWELVHPTLDLAGAATLDQDRQRISEQSYQPKPQRDQQDGLDRAHIE